MRTQHEGRPLRTLYAFDPRRKAILLIGGDKTGDNRWYDVHIPIADRLYDEHLALLKKKLGGKLEILASFPDGTVQINNFSDLG